MIMGKRCPGERDHRETGPSSGQWVETRTERRRTATIKAREREKGLYRPGDNREGKRMTDGRGKKKKAERKIRSDRKKTDRQREREREREREETKNERKGENPEKAISADPVISEKE